MSSRMFPMLDGPSLPWALAEIIYRAYDRVYGHDQTMEKMAQRGGFGWGEIPQIFEALRRRDRALYRELMVLSGTPERELRRLEAMR